MRILLAVLILTLPIHLPAAEKQQKKLLTTELTGRDLEFFRGAGESALLLSELNKLAADRLNTAEIKALDTSLSEGQAGVREEMSELAKARRIEAPAQPGGAQAAMLKRLSGLEGPKFEKAYLEALIDAQEAQLRAFEAGSGSADPEIKALAEKVLPGIREHVQNTRKLAGAS